MTMTKIISDREAKAKRKKAIQDMPLVTKTVLEHAMGCYGLCNETSCAGILSRLQQIEEMRQYSEEGTTIGELARRFLRARLEDSESNCRD